MKILHIVTFALVIIGAVNWGLVGLLNYNLVDQILSPFGLTNLVYVLVGASGVYLAVTHMNDCKYCASMKGKGKK